MWSSSGNADVLWYGFYYRGTYSYDLIEDPKRSLASDAMQIRNATLDFISMESTRQQP